MKKIILFVLIAVLFVTPITFLSSKQPVSAQSISNYDASVKQGEIVKVTNTLLNSEIKNADIEMIDTYYNHLTAEVKQLEQSIGRVPGSTKRKKLADTYLVPAKVTIERVIYEVSQYRLMLQISDSIGNGEIEKAESNMMKLERLKKRAVMIKQAGGYEELPFAINIRLRQNEAILQGDILYLRVYPYRVAIDAGNLNEYVNGLYDDITKQLKLTEQRIGQVPGHERRSELNKFYVKPTKEIIERTIYEISQYRILALITNDLEKLDMESVKKRFETLNRLKDRAAKIKDAGDYDPLPVEIEEFLRAKEYELLNPIKASKVEENQP
ncbi:hypothetical protein [Metabacillus fastidiosus]|uniref:hypothetical protein n=1 Tax=Metabacillus fastidiosus TaxID=1458 RepID=UPI002DBBECA2|nr:hypothetical protein [Metabacillus fastidiosus]MEC2074581.1 hypothetical protein [Metabacillus fastidiosus]